MNLLPRFMNPRPSRLPSHSLSLAATLSLLALAIVAARFPAAASLKPANTPPAEEVVTQSMFTLPASPLEGRDPFYPHSMRPYAGYLAAHTNRAVVEAAPIVELHLNGISGSAARPLAIINNRTFEVGEQADVYSNAGRSRIRCIEIGPDSVIIQIGGERRMLHLRSGL